jgi:hypothetical protein
MQNHYTELIWTQPYIYIYIYIYINRNWMVEVKTTDWAVEFCKFLAKANSYARDSGLSHGNKTK